MRRCAFVALLLCSALTGCTGSTAPGDGAPGDTESTGSGDAGSGGEGSGGDGDAGGDGDSDGDSQGSGDGDGDGDGDSGGSGDGDGDSGGSGTCVLPRDDDASYFYHCVSETKIGFWGDIFAFNRSDGMLEIEASGGVASADAPGLFWAATETQNETRDVSAFGSVAFTIDTPVDVELYLYSGAPVEADEWTEFGWPIPAWIAREEGEFDVYFIPAGTRGEVSISLDQTMPKARYDRFRQVQFRVLQPGTLSLGEVRLIPEDTPIVPLDTENKFDPGPGHTYLTVGQERDGMMDYWNAAALPRPAGLMYYLSAANGGFGWTFWLDASNSPTGSDEHDIGEMNAPAFWEDERFDGTFAQIGLSLKYSDDDRGYPGVGCPEIASLGGTWDDERKYRLGRGLAELEAHLKSAHRPVFLRIGFEPENADHDCGGGPSGYVAAYRYVVDFLRSKHVDNVAFVHHPYNGIYGQGTIYGNPRLPYDSAPAWYPGDEYVDWIGLSDFTEAGLGAGQLQQAGFLSSVLPWFVEFAKQHGKPVMIAEATVQDENGDGSVPRTITDLAIDEWLEPLLSLVEGRAVSAGGSSYTAGDTIRMISYVHSTWNYGHWNRPEFGAGWWIDTRFADPAIQARFADRIENPPGDHRYLKMDDIRFDPSQPTAIEVCPPTGC